VAGVPAVPADSAVAAVRAADSGTVQPSPAQPLRGGVLFALAEGVEAYAPRCTWDGAPLPCYATASGVLAIVPLPADRPGGTHTIGFELPGGQSALTRAVAVGDRDLGREIVFLDRAHYALFQRAGEIAREARALRAVLSGEAPARQWQGQWRDPVPIRGATGYGVERYYYPASDSSRAVPFSALQPAHGSFAADTVDWRVNDANDAPSWRHSGADVALSRGAPVSAPAAGVVADVGDYVLTGHTVVLDHGQGVFTAYFHLDTALVHRGDVVRPGTVVGRVGEAGLVTGPHLHYGVYVHGTDVDPTAWRELPDFVVADSAPARADGGESGGGCGDSASGQGAAGRPAHWP
jgi:murein DD-endopeptidase MepM/ murein hydrolase activator NlpD